MFAVWHSPVVRSHLVSQLLQIRCTSMTNVVQSLDDVDFTVLAATSVLTDLIENCPPAEGCKDAFDRMSKATIQMCMSTTGFGASAAQHIRRKQATIKVGSAKGNPPSLQRAASSTANIRQAMNATSLSYTQQNQVPQFDMNLTDLFSEAESKSQAFNRPSLGLQFRQPQMRAGQANMMPYSSGPRYGGMTSHQQQSVGGYQESNLTPLTQVSTPVLPDVTTQTSIRPQSATSNQAYQTPMQQSQRPSQSPTQTRQQTFRPPSVSAPDSTAFISSIPNDMLAGVETDTAMGDMNFATDFNFDDFNDAGVDFNVINGMLTGGASMFDGSRGGLEQWDDGNWNMPQFDGSGEDSGDNTGNGNGGSGGMDMFGGLFFGGS